ncbi:MAG: hypothetical protein RIF34_00985, partial [Candidatus Kapaibacterium sp.]
SYIYKKNKSRSLFMIALMLFVSTSTFPYFGDMLARANITINEINEEENETHNTNTKNKVGAYCSIDELHKFLSDYSTNLSSITYNLKQYADYIPEDCTPPPEQIQLQSI